MQQQFLSVTIKHSIYNFWVSYIRFLAYFGKNCQIKRVTKSHCVYAVLFEYNKLRSNLLETKILNCGFPPMYIHRSSFFLFLYQMFRVPSEGSVSKLKVRWPAYEMCIVMYSYFIFIITKCKLLIRYSYKVSMCIV